MPTDDDTNSFTHEVLNEFAAAQKQVEGEGIPTRLPDHVMKALLSSVHRAPIEKAAAPRKRMIATPKCGQRGQPFRRIIKHDSVGPIERIVGVKTLQVTETLVKEVPDVRMCMVHHLLHATKGWREYHNIIPQPRGSRTPQLPPWHRHVPKLKHRKRAA